MKKYLPIILFVVGIVFLVGIVLLIKSNRHKGSEEETETVAEIPLEQRPMVSLTPTADGHWLNLVVSKIKVEAQSLDYELLYKLPDGRTQGVPGSVSLGGKTDFERKLLLGSESSGKFRYDEGVEAGTLTLRFRNDKGKLVGKLSTEFHLQSNTQLLASVDGDFKLNLDTKLKEGFFVVMETFGLPGEFTKAVASGPYGVFSSVETPLKSSVKIKSHNVYYYGSDSGWKAVKSDTLNLNQAVFVASSE